MKMNIVNKKRPYDYDCVKADLKLLKKEYKNFAVGSLGKSMLGENIYFAKIGNGTKKVMINASHHANEWLSSLVLMMFMEKYLLLRSEGMLYKGYDIEELYNNTSLYLIPMVNPDGVGLVLNNKKVLNNPNYEEIRKPYLDELYRWKANIRGVGFINFHLMPF